jgi:hypothetical protein
VVFELTKGPQDKMGGLVVRASNKYTFLSTAGLLLTWHILLDGVPLMVGDPAQGDAEGWYPGGSVPFAPQVSLCWQAAVQRRCSARVCPSSYCVSHAAMTRHFA